MGWERRKRGGRYYTRSKRVNGRIVREYLGTGEVAEAIATLDACDRAQREEQRAAHRQEVTEQVAFDRDIGELGQATELLVAVELYQAGYHQHRGEWRRRRNDDIG